MTNAELAEQLNARLGLKGRDALTANVVRQWVAWDVLSEARVQGRTAGKGPIWTRDERSLRRARRLAELRKAGVRRQKALIVQAYIEWGHSDFCRVRDALRDEFSKWRNQLNRRQITFIGEGGFANLSETGKRAIANQLGPLDNRFVGTQFQQSAARYAVCADLARTAEGNPNALVLQLIEAFQKAYPEMDIVPISEPLTSIALGLSGLTGLPDEIENSGESTIAIASERQFRIARVQTRGYLKLLREAGRYDASPGLGSEARELLQMLHSLAPQISTGPWLTFVFAQLLHYVFRQSELHRN